MASKWKVAVPVLLVVGALAAALVLLFAGTDETSPGSDGVIETVNGSDSAGTNESFGALGALPGSYEISARVAGECGTYDVFLMANFSADGKVALDKLFNTGGQVFESAAGLWESELAVATFADESQFDVWVLRFDRPGVVALYNAYGPSSPVVLADTEVDLADYVGVDSVAELAEVTAGAVDTCIPEVSEVNVTFTPLP